MVAFQGHSLRLSVAALILYVKNQPIIKSTFSIKGVNYAKYHTGMYHWLNIISDGNQRSRF
jgi:hypothetical protein